MCGKHGFTIPQPQVATPSEKGNASLADIGNARAGVALALRFGLLKK